MQGHYVLRLQCNVIKWEQPKRNLFQRYRKHKLYNTMLTRLVRQCCKQVAGQKPKPSLLPLSNLHFPPSSAFLSPPFPNKKGECHKWVKHRHHQMCQQQEIKIVYFSLMTTHLLLFSCTLHRLCISLLSRGRLLCFSCKDSLSAHKLQPYPSLYLYASPLTQGSTTN